MGDAFIINITPERTKKPLVKNDKEPTHIVLGRFQGKQTVIFENVPVGKTARRTVYIGNRYDKEVKAMVTKLFKPEYNVSLEWITNVIPPHEEISLEVIWNPLLVVASKEILQFTDNLQGKTEISFVFKSIKKNNLVKPMKGLRHSTISSTQSIKPKETNNPSSRTNSQSTEKFSKGENVFPLTDKNKRSDNEKEVRGVTMRTEVSVSSHKGNKENVIPSLAGNKTSSVLFRENTSEYLSLHSVPHNGKLNTLKSPSQTFVVQGKLPYDDCDELHDLQLSIKSEIPFSATTLEINDSTNELKSFQPNVCSTVTKRATGRNKDFYKKEEGFKKVEDEILYLQASEENLKESEIRRANCSFNQTATIRPSSYHQLSIITEEERSQDYTFSLDTTLQRTYRINQEDSRIIHENRNDGNARASCSDKTPRRKHSDSLVDLSQKPYNPAISANQGSMPNLNEMKQINSIENNRYYYQNRPEIYLNTSDDFTSSITSVASTTDIPFNQRDILAQSSTRNLCNHRKTFIDKSPSFDNFKGKAMLNKTAISPTLPMPQFTPRRRSNSFSENMSNSRKKNSMSNSSYFVLTPPRKSKLSRRSMVNSKMDEIGSHNMDASFENRDDLKLSSSCQLFKRSRLDVLMNTNRDPKTTQLYDIETFMRSCINPDPFAATTTFDPFLAHCVYLDSVAYGKYETQMKKWLNALVSIPQEFNVHNKTIDVGNLFNEVRNKQMMLAPTKEQVTMNYLNGSRMDHLRGAAINLFMSPELSDPCSKVAIHIKKGNLRVRRESNPHLDVVLQKTILGLLLGFHPIWLRIGLEVVFGEIIHLNSNTDIVGLSTFIINRLLKRKGKEQLRSKAYTLTEEYSEEVTKFTLQKILFLLIFLDKAKEKNLIKHNPCLFMKTSPYKETKDILIKISAELVSSVGDIIRELKRFGYVLTHKQTPLDEYNYAFENLAVDLRDGVRLVRVVEVIVMRTDLTAQLRYPAISRLQKVANVNLALRALKEANFVLTGNIQAGDIVDGYKEKTLSLLWQIIYKFRAPKFNLLATIIQKWWRKLSLKVFIRRRIEEKIKLKRNKAATIIQAAFKGYKTRKYTRILKEEKTKAATCLQKYCRMYLVPRIFLIKKQCIISIQNWYRQLRITRSIRSKYLYLREKVIIIQKWYRKILLARKLENAASVIKEIKLEARYRHEKAVIIQRSIKSFIVRKKFKKIVFAIVISNRTKNVEYRSATKIQSFFKMLQKRNEFRNKCSKAIIIQRYWRSYLLMKQLKSDYLRKRECTKVIQKYFRNYLEMKNKRSDFLRIRSACVLIQQRYTANKMMIQQKEKYLILRKSVLLIQRKWRATLNMRKTRQEYLNVRTVIVNLQVRFRARNLMKKQRSQYLTCRAAIIKIQIWYRSLVSMRKERSKFHLIQNKIILIQQKWRATLLSRRMRLQFVSLQYNTILMQQRFRANRLMKCDRENYIKLLNSTIVIQRRFRANIAMKQARNEYLANRNLVISLQRRFRANQEMLEQKKKYIELKRASLVIQRRFRANQLMKYYRCEYIRFRNSVIIIQQKYRAILLSRQIEKNYIDLRKATIAVQRRFRAKIAMRVCYKEYNNTKAKIITIQIWFRSCLKMKIERSRFLLMKEAACKIQSWYRRALNAREIKRKYKKTLENIRFIQKLWRSKIQMREERRKYIEKRNAVIRIQQYFRSYLLTKQCRSDFILFKSKVTFIQVKYRAKLEMLQVRREFIEIKSVVIDIQRKLRAKKAMRIERTKFLQLKYATTFIQEKYRGRRLMQIQSKEFQEIRCCILKLQTRVRGLLARRRFNEMLTPEKKEFIRQKKAARVIQKYCRGWLVRKRFKSAKLKHFRQRLKEMKLRVKPENTIRYKIKQALGFLKGKHPINDLLANLKLIENISRVLPYVLSNYAFDIAIYCYGTMTQAIRSEYDKLIIERCSCIILNLIRYEKLNIKEYIEEDWFVTIAQMLLRWCDKDCEIFNTLCTLIWILTRDLDKKMKIRGYMSTRDAIYMLKEIKKLAIRKENMRRNARKYNNSNGDTSLIENRRRLPFLKPDYGFIGKQPYIFNCSIFAFDTVLKELQITV